MNDSSKAVDDSSMEKSRRIEQFPLNFFTIFCLNRIIANIYKDIIKCKRNKKYSENTFPFFPCIVCPNVLNYIIYRLMIVQLIVPLIQITFFCICIGRPPFNLPVGFVNYDKNNSKTNLSELFINAIDNQTIIKVSWNLITIFHFKSK